MYWARRAFSSGRRGGRFFTRGMSISTTRPSPVRQQFPEEGIDVLIIETTRGDHETPPGFTRAGEEKRLAEAISGGVRRGGAIVMPLFALGKTQELLVMLH